MSTNRYHRIRTLRYHQPKSLLELCYRKSGSLLNILCYAIEKKHGNYDQSQCRIAIDRLQQHLIMTLVSLFDNVGQRAIQWQSYHRSLQDMRILFATIMHKNLESLIILKTPHLQYSSIDLIRSRLSRMPNLVQLDLSGFECDDETLEVIANTCLKLKSLTVNMPVMDCTNLVSDAGFAHLSNLSSLRVLRDSSGNSLLNINQPVIFDLLQHLKKLEVIDSFALGEVVDEYVKMQSSCSRSLSGNCVVPVQNVHSVEPLALTCVKVDFVNYIKKMSFSQGVEPRITLISSLAKACPKLTILHLLGFDICTPTIRSEFILNLTNSSLQLTELALEGFPFDDYFKQFLTKKGSHLKKFMYSPPTVSPIYVQTISELCPNVPNVRFTSNYLNTRPTLEDRLRDFSIVGGL